MAPRRGPAVAGAEIHTAEEIRPGYQVGSQGGARAHRQSVHEAWLSAARPSTKHGGQHGAICRITPLE